MKAAERLFAESGYDGTKIRAIVAKAKVNQAAINYHFEGKDGLYREVLREAFRRLTEHQLSHAEELKLMSREEALSQFIRRQLQPLVGRDEYSRHMRILNWETVQPTAVFRSLIAEEAAPFLGLAADLVRRFLPDADQRTVTIAAVWLLGQCSVFQRNREQLAEPPREARPRRARSRMAQHRDQPLIGCRSGSGRRRSNAPLPLMNSQRGCPGAKRPSEMLPLCGR